MRLGHFALSQTVSKFSSSNKLAVKWLAFPLGTLRLSHRGKRRSGVLESSCTKGKVGVLSDILGVGVDLDTVVRIK